MPHPPKLVEYYEFVRWIATPTLFRKPQTQGEFQKDHGVSAQTLANWKKDENFWEDVRREIREWTKDKTPDVIASIGIEAVRGNVTAQKLWIELFERSLIPDKAADEAGNSPQTFFEIMKIRHDKRIQSKQSGDSTQPRP